MKTYKIYGKVYTWELLYIKFNIEDMYKFVCDCYENNPINYLVIEKNIELDSKCPLVSIINEEKYLKFKEEYKPYAKVKKI